MKEQSPAFTAETFEETSPLGVIDAMFAATGPNGDLLIPGQYCDGGPLDGSEPFVFHCRMRAGAEKQKERIKKEFSELKERIKRVSAFSDRLGEDEEENKALLGDLYGVWERYLRYEEPAGADPERLSEIWDKLLIGEALPEEEKAVFRSYLQARDDAAARRIGAGVAAGDAVFHARRLFLLYSLGAPEIVTEEEARKLAQAMTLRACALSRSF